MHVLLALAGGTGPEMGDLLGWRGGAGDLAARAGHFRFPQATAAGTTSDRAVSRTGVLWQDAP
jgi:hypothetical protein